MTVMKIDKFAVPGPSMDEFLAEAGRTQALLGRQPGFVAGHVLQLRSGGSAYNVVSVVQWAGPDAVDGARRAVETDHRARGFDRAVFRDRLGISSDEGLYEPVVEPGPS